MSTSTPPPKYLQEDELSQECRDLMSSLPKEKGWVLPNIYQYQGFWHTPRQLQGVLSCQQNFQAQNSDIILVTNPKSGSTWLKALIFAVINRKLYPKNTQYHPLLSNNPHILLPFLEFHVYIENQVPDFTSFPNPRLFSTHMPFSSLPNSMQNTPCKLVYLCRNPKDTLISLWKFSNKLVPQNVTKYSLEEAFDMFCKGVSICGPFWDHVLGYYKESLRQPHKVFFLKYEEMKEEPSFHIRKLAEFIGFPFSQEEESEGVMEDILGLCSFDKLRNLEVNKVGKLPSGEENNAFFRRGEVGDWKNYLFDEMVDRMEKSSLGSD